MSRHTSERFEEISCAIFVPLATTVACSINKRTMRPRRKSVAWACDAGVPFDGIEADCIRAGWRLRIVVAFLMEELCGNSRETTIASLKFISLLLIRHDLDQYPRGHNPEAHVDCLGRVCEQADGNEIHAGFGVGADV